MKLADELMISATKLISSQPWWVWPLLIIALYIFGKWIARTPEVERRKTRFKNSFFFGMRKDIYNLCVSVRDILLLPITLPILLIQKGIEWWRGRDSNKKRSMEVTTATATETEGGRPIDQLDGQLKRCRGCRTSVLILSAATAAAIPPPISSMFFGDVFGWYQIGLVIGSLTWPYFIPPIIQNSVLKVEAGNAFVTVDHFFSLFGSEKVYTSYGPGFHFIFWWEDKSEIGNISLRERAQSLEMILLTTTGDATLRGSFRMRPNIQGLPTYAFGAAAVAEDIIDLIRKFILRLVEDEGMGINELLKSSNFINQKLEDEFKDAVSATEERFQVIVSDVSIAEILPSEAVRKAIAGKAEQKVILESAAEACGYESSAAAQEAIKNKELSEERFLLERRLAMAISENSTMTIDRNEYAIDITGFDAETVKVLASAAGKIADVKMGKGGSK